MRNLEIIGEAVKGLSSEFRKNHQGVPWQDIAGMRDRLIHDYAGVNWDIVWDVLQTKLPESCVAIWRGRGCNSAQPSRGEVRISAGGRAGLALPEPT